MLHGKKMMMISQLSQDSTSLNANFTPLSSASGVSADEMAPAFHHSAGCGNHRQATSPLESSPPSSSSSSSSSSFYVLRPPKYDTCPIAIDSSLSPSAAAAAARNPFLDPTPCDASETSSLYSQATTISPPLPPLPSSSSSPPPPPLSPPAVSAAAMASLPPLASTNHFIYPPNNNINNNNRRGVHSPTPSFISEAVSKIAHNIGGGGGGERGKRDRHREPKSFNCFKLTFKLLIVFFSFTGFIYQAHDICTHYYSYRTVVYTNTEQDSLVDLPSITFCLPTYFTKKTIEEMYAPYIKRNVDETAGLKNRTMIDAITPVIYETFQKQAFKDMTAAEILDRSISDDGIIECRLFYPPQHWPNLTRERMYEIVQYGLPCEEVTQVIPSINANGKCFTFFSQLLTDGEALRAAYQQQQAAESSVEYQQYPQMTSFATNSASSASTRSSGPVAPPILHHSHRYVPVLHKIAVNHGYRFHSGRFMRLQVQFNRDQYTVISDGHQRECIQVHPPFKIPSEACLHSINPGMSYDFVLTKTKAILQPPPYQTNCQSYQVVTPAESELFASHSDASDLKDFYLKPMSRSDCIDKCMIHLYEKHCGCLPIHISIWQRSTMFLNMSVCDYEDYERISPCLEKELSSACYDMCKSDCIDRHYHLHAESRVYPSDDQIRQATGVEKARLERLRHTAATISIWSNYLSDITYVHTPAMSLIQLICYLGGLAGLWLGVSVMTVSGWLAQLYQFMQKWKVKQRLIILGATRQTKNLLDSVKNFADRTRSNDGYRQARVVVSNRFHEPRNTTANDINSSNRASATIFTNDSEHFAQVNQSSNHRNHAYPFARIIPTLVKQSSVSSTATDADSGLSIESKSSFEDTVAATAAVVEDIEDLLDDDDYDDDDHDHHNRHHHHHNHHQPNNNHQYYSHQQQPQQQQHLIERENAIVNASSSIANVNSSVIMASTSSGNTRTAITTTTASTDGKRRRHSMAPFATVFSSTFSSAANNSSNTSSIQPANSNHLENAKNHRWSLARRSVYWSNYSSMSTSSDDLSLISNATTTSSVNSGANLVSSVASTAIRRMSLVNSKFSCKV